MSTCRALHSTWQKPSRKQRMTCARIRRPCTATSTSPRTWLLSSTPWQRKEHSMSKPLAHKVALVTGGSRGIGAAIARRLAHDGADVAISYSGSADRAEALVRELKDLG